MRRLLAAFALSLALAVGLAPGLALAVDGNLAAGNADTAQALTTQAASAPTVTVTRAATGKVAVKVGKSYKLGAKTTAGKLTYKSSKKSVATVSSKGVVKAKKAGKATITVTAKSGSKKATKKVTVTVLAAKKYKAVKKVKAKASATNLKVGNAATVKATFTPTKASNKNVTYKSSNAKVLTVDANGKGKAVKAGTAKVTVTSCDNAKAKASVTIKVANVAGVPVKANLAKYTWTELKKLSDAIAAAKSDEAGLEIAKAYHLASDTGYLGNGVKPLKLWFMNGESKEEPTVDVRILGFRHDTKASGGKAGITFMCSDDIWLRAMNRFKDTNEGGWKGCDMRTWLNADVYDGLPADLRKNIVAVKKKTNNVGWVDSSDTSVVTATTDKLWLPSVVEVYGTDLESAYSWYVDIYYAEGSQYKFYKDLGVTGSSNYWGAAESWHVWLRSPLPNNDTFFCSINASDNEDRKPGEPTAQDGGFGRGVYPCFCL